MDEDDIKRDFDRFSGLTPPVKRAAYSDRTAWLMAILAELAYTRFDQEDDSSLLSMAAELAELTDQEEIAERLKKLGQVLENRDNSENKILRGLLDAGGFELKGVLFDEKTDTQGYVAVRRDSSGAGLGMAVVVFRGTQQFLDWKTNMNTEAVPVYSTGNASGAQLGQVHKGFNTAFLSVMNQIEDLLKGEEDLPRYHCGHSLGGALATLATWYTKGEKLAACYTFGAPRVGDDGLSDRFRTPIYRIVNGADPVPFVPPSGKTISVLKVVVRAVGTVITPVNLAANWLVKRQGYRHYGYQRYLTICEPGPDGSYPDLKNEHGISALDRLYRFAKGWFEEDGSGRKRIDKYHNMAEYRVKLRVYAKRRQQDL